MPWHRWDLKWTEYLILPFSSYLTSSKLLHFQAFLLDFSIPYFITLWIVHDHLLLWLFPQSAWSTIGPIHVQPLQGIADSCYSQAFLKHKAIAFPQVPAFIIDFIQSRLLYRFKRQFPRRKKKKKKINIQTLTPKTASFRIFTIVLIEGKAETRLQHCL